jgi:hypothetical protein
MSVQIAKEELLSLNEYQKQIHYVSSFEEPIISNFYKEFIKSTWYSSMPLKLKSTVDGEEVVYAVNVSFHFLMYSYMRFVLPAINVKPEYKGKVRIAWCHNVGTNIVNNAYFKDEDDVYQKWDNVWADMYFQFYQKSGAGKRKNHNIGVGNVKCVEDWCETLPAYPINVEQPWFYSMDTALSFPIFYKNSQSRSEHRYSFRRRVVDLLRVQVLGKENKWKDTTRNISRYLDINSSRLINLPELWGRYAYITDKEIGFLQCKDTRYYYIRDIEICDTTNPNKYKSTADIELHSESPCLAIFWVAENRDSSAVHNYSNYTTDTYDLYKGWDPIKTTTLKYGTSSRLVDMPSDHFNIAESRYHFPSSPGEVGYHAYSYAWDSTNFHGDIGIVLSAMNAKLHCKIANNNIYINNYGEDEEKEKKEDDESAIEQEDTDDELIEEKSNAIEEPSPNFITRARLLIIRKFTISKKDNKYIFRIE